MRISRIRLTVISYCFVVGMIAVPFMMVSSGTAARELSLSTTTSLSDDAIDRWQILADMSAGRGDPGVVVVHDKIHVISGFFSPGYNYVYSQEVYNLQTGTWQRLMGSPIPRSDFVAVNFEDKIYTIGGWNIDPNYEYDGVVDINHMYDPQTDTWDTTKQPLPTPVSGAGGVVLNDKIYVIGGHIGDQMNTNIVQIYDPASDSWSEGTPMQSARAELGAVVLNGLVYAIGGQASDNPSDIEIYDPVSDTWSDGPALPERRLSMAVAVKQGKIYVIGGTENFTAPNAEDSVFIYDPETNLWSMGAPMPTARYACRGAVVGDDIYVIGGVGELGAGTANESYGPFPSPVYLPLCVSNPN